jgi:protein-S-isoprenylcysteine O-methyltransferase Ste14
MNMKGFREWIIGLIYKGVTSPNRIRVILTPLIGISFLCIILLAIFISFYVDRFLGFPGFISKPYGIAISMPFLLTGFSLWIGCAWRFFKANGTPVPINPPPKLITDGPYAYSRNPMMTGIFAMLAGIGILFRSITLTFITTPIFVFISILEFKYIEEPELEKRFGKEYSEYKERTPIIIPKIR